MARIPDYSRQDEEQDRRPASVSVGSTPAPAAPMGGGRAPAPGGPPDDDAFVPWERFVGANEGVAKREAGRLKSSAQSQVDKAQQGLKSASEAQSAAVESNYNTTPVAQTGFGASSQFGGAKQTAPQG